MFQSTPAPFTPADDLEARATIRALIARIMDTGPLCADYPHLLSALAAVRAGRLARLERAA